MGMLADYKCYIVS